MLSRVEVQTRQGALLKLPLDDTATGLIVEEIEGLDPVKATLVSSSFAGADGEQYHSARRETRNIKLKLGLMPDYVTQAVQDLRNRLYSFLMPKSDVLLRFVMTDGEFVEIRGRVETFTTPLFSSEPGVDISLTCFDPDFIDPTVITIPGMTTSGNTGMNIEYAGTVETGMVITLRPNRTLSAFTIYHTPPDGTLRMLDFSAPLVAGDELRISTVSGAKALTLKRSNTESSVLYGMSPQSAWLEFQQGVNDFRVYATGAAIPFDIQYTARYGGL